jgi:two-component sensor histidine kinase
VLAIAAVHERLYTVALDLFLGDLCRDIGRALGCSEGIELDIGAIEVSTDMAIPLALIVNELLNNAIKHVGPPCRIAMRISPLGTLTMRISDTGQGAPEAEPHVGMGSRIVAALGAQLEARIGTIKDQHGYTVELTIPVGDKR